VIKELEKKENIAVIIVGGADEKGLNIVYSDSTIDLRGCTTLLGLAEVLKRADIVLTNDSSPIHIASAWEKPHILAIFGPTIKEFGFTPWSTNSEVLQIENLDCRPCSIHGGDKCPKGHFKCMMDITPEKVLDKLC
ncbi:MAG: glycosyltransferase family 9 protein, partial [Cetobacterium sp.]